MHLPPFSSKIYDDSSLAGNNQVIRSQLGGDDMISNSNP